MGSLVVPIVVWSGGSGKNSPTHRVSSLLLTPDCNTLISGSVDGHIILWNLHLENGTLEPVSVLLGHTAQVTALCVSNDPNSPLSLSGCPLGGPKGTFISASENGDVCLWDLSDGRCLEVNKFQGHHIGMQRLPVREHSGIRVLLYGYYNDIYVIDGCSLTHLYSLSSRLSPDWISAVTLVRPIVQAGKLKVRMVDSPEKWDGVRKRPTLRQITLEAGNDDSTGDSSEKDTDNENLPFPMSRSATRAIEKLSTIEF